MKACGIVCEYNPFHTGHKHQIDFLKERGFAVVCLMSGSFVERGEPAVFGKECRAELAAKNGADLVLELPFPYSAFGAELFARAGVSVLDKTGICTSICFGSESADADLLECAAEYLVSNEFSARIRELCNADRTLSFARARSIALFEKIGQNFSTPNDILEVEYLKAIKTLGASLSPIVIKRSGAGYYEKEEDGFASASYLRELIYGGSLDEAGKFIPNFRHESLESPIKINPEKYFCALSLAVMTLGKEGLSDIAEIGGGLEHSVYSAVLSENTIMDIAKRLSAKHLTETKIRRMLLFALTGVTKGDMKSLPAYTRVLAVGEKGYELLRMAKASVADGFSLISGAPHLASASEDAKRQFEFNKRAERILEIIQ